MKIPYLGKMMLFWCKSCNVPVLAKKCARCEGLTEKVEVTPPGDIRPAFDSDVELINKTTKKEFGSRLIPKNKIILLNSAPGLDRFDEIIMDGRVIGVLKYDAVRLEYSFLPRIAGARMLEPDRLKKYVEIAGIVYDWFLGKNLKEVVLYDDATGGCFDGINPKGLNLNQGAESTLAHLLARLEMETIRRLQDVQQ